jgi:hypothetical protein
MSTFDQSKSPWTKQEHWEQWRDSQVQSFALDDDGTGRLRQLLDEAALIGTCAAAECVRDDGVTSSFSLGVSAQRLLGLRRG